MCCAVALTIRITIMGTTTMNITTMGITTTDITTIPGTIMQAMITARVLGSPS
jgi:hypothetical protein